MLLQQSKRTWRELIENEPTFVVLPATRPTESDIETRKRASDLALAARVEEHGVRALRDEHNGLYVAVLNPQSLSVGFARKMVREGKTAEPWFLFRHNETSASETADGSRVNSTLTDTGFVLPDSRAFTVVNMYHPAQNATSWGHSQGYDVGEHLCDVVNCRSLRKTEARKTA